MWRDFRGVLSGRSRLGRDQALHNAVSIEPGKRRSAILHFWAFCRICLSSYHLLSVRILLKSARRGCAGVEGSRCTAYHKGWRLWDVSHEERERDEMQVDAACTHASHQVAAVRMSNAFCPRMISIVLFLDPGYTARACGVALARALLAAAARALSSTGCFRFSVSCDSTRRAQHLSPSDPLYVYARVAQTHERAGNCGLSRYPTTRAYSYIIIWVTVYLQISCSGMHVRTLSLFGTSELAFRTCVYHPRSARACGPTRWKTTQTSIA